MAKAGTLIYDTKLDTSGIDKGLKGMTGKVQTTGSTIKSILGSLGIAAVVSKGIQLINSSLDDSIRRFDIMNNFPKVMSNLGIASKDAKKSIDLMSEKLMGLPTTLDEAALAVQRFTSANGDVKKSTDIFLAVNNAILAGGASSQIQAQALEQLSQAYAKGKPDMMEWRSMMTAMPAQLTQIAKAMGYINTADLGEAIRAKGGEKEFQRFINTIVKLNKKGANGFASLEEQARGATSGIQTAMKNMKSRTVQGVTAMIDAFDKTLRKTKFKNIAGLLEGIGNFFRDNLKKLAKSVEKLPLDKFFNILKALKPAIGGVVAGLVAMDGAVNVMKVGNLVKDIVKMIAAFGPIGIAVGGVTALATALVLFSKSQQVGTKVTQQTNETLKNYASSVRDAKAAKDEYLSQNLGEITHYQDLKNELDSLINKNGKVKKGYEDRAKFIVSTLNDALGTEISITKGVIKNYDKISNSIQKVIDKKKAQIILDAHEKEYANAVKQRTELEKAYRSQLSENQNLESKQKTLLEEMANATGKSTEELEKYITTSGQFKVTDLDLNVRTLAVHYNNLSRKVSESNKSLKEARNEYAENQSVMKQYEDAATQMQKGHTNAVMKIYDDTVNYTGKTSTEIYNDYQNRINQQRDYINQLKINKDGYDKSFIDSEIRRANSNIKNLKSEQNQYKTVTGETQKNIKGIWNQGMTDLIEDLTGKKVTFKQVGKDSFQMYIDGVAEGKPMSRKKAKEVTKGMIDELNKGKKEGKTAGTDLIQGVEDGIDYKKGSAFSTIASFGKNLLKNLKASLKEKSPSKATFEMGEFLDIGVIEGIESSKKKVLKTADLFGQDIIKKMQSAITLETGNITANASVKGNSFLNTMVVNSQVTSDVYLDKTKVGQAVTPVVSQTLKKAGVR